MNRVELIEHLATTHELSKAEAGRVLSTLLDAIVTTVRKGGAGHLQGARRRLRAGARSGHAAAIAACASHRTRHPCKVFQGSLTLRWA